MCLNKNKNHPQKFKPVCWWLVLLLLGFVSSLFFFFFFFNLPLKKLSLFQGQLGLKPRPGSVLACDNVISKWLAWYISS